MDVVFQEPRFSCCYVLRCFVRQLKKQRRREAKRENKIFSRLIFFLFSCIKKNRMMSTKIAAIAQLCSTSNKLHNLYNIAHCAGWAKKHGASMLFLPECFGFIGSNVDQTLKNAERIPYENDEDLHDFKNEVEEDWYSSLEKIIMECSNDDDLSKPRLNTGDDNKHNNQVSILNGLRVIAKKSDLFISAGGIHESCAPPLITEGSTKDRVYNTHLILNNKGEIVS